MEVGWGRWGEMKMGWGVMGWEFGGRNENRLKENENIVAL
jgi:hypothetical protein